MVPKSKLVVEWSYRGHLGKGDVIYEIIKSDDTTDIRLTNKVTEDFDDNIPWFRRESAENGWNYIIKDKLVNLLGEQTALTLRSIHNLIIRLQLRPTLTTL